MHAGWRRDTIEQALQHFLETVQARPERVAIIVFGSYINGDMWEQSDLDLFLIVEGTDAERQEPAMLTVDGVTVHLQAFTRTSFLTKVGKGPVGWPFHTALRSGRLLFCRDPEVREAVEALAEIPAADRALRVMEEVSRCASYLEPGSTCASVAPMRPGWPARRRRRAGRGPGCSRPGRCRPGRR